jgi:hypothetical protein
MLVEAASQIVSSRKIEVDCETPQFSGASLHGGNKSASYSSKASIARDPQIAQPQALLACMSLKSSAERGKTNDSACVLGNNTFEPPVRTKSTG